MHLRVPLTLAHAKTPNLGKREILDAAVRPRYPEMGSHDSKSYSTAALQASFVRGSIPCLRRLPRSGNQASHAEQLCTLRTEASVEVEVGMDSELWRERLEERESWGERRD